MADQPTTPKRRAPTLYAIIAFKLIKGLVLVLVAFGVYSMRDKDLPESFRNFLLSLHLDPEREFFSYLGDQIEKITPGNVRAVAIGTFLYSLFSLVEGVGLTFRVSWAGWLVIGESVFFIPIELYQLIHGFSWPVFVILAINVWIVCYLLVNRRRLFRHHH